MRRRKWLAQLIDGGGFPPARFDAGGEARYEGARSNGGGTPSSAATGLQPAGSAHNPPASFLDDTALAARRVVSEWTGHQW